MWGQDEGDQTVPERFPDEVLREASFWSWAPDVILMEGGLFEPGPDLQLRVPRTVLERFCAAGGVVIVADADARLLRQQRELYRATVDGRDVAFPFAGQISWIDGCDGPVYAWTSSTPSVGPIARSSAGPSSW